MASMGVRAVLFSCFVLTLVFFYSDTPQTHHVGRKLLYDETVDAGAEDSGMEDSGIEEPAAEGSGIEPEPPQCGKKDESEEDAGMFPTDAFTDTQLKNGAVVLHIIGILYMFYALALVCDEYFVPSLDVIIEKLGISPDVAGATFMAAGGSAPELFTSIIGVFIAVSDVGIGTIVGSAVFNVLFVIAACAFAAAEALALTAWPLMRDTVFYSIALVLLVGFFVDNKIRWWEALILFLWYGAYVGFMKFNAKFEEMFLTQFPSLKKEKEEGAPEFNAGFKFNKHRKPLLKLMRDQVEATKKVPEEEAEEMQPLKAETETETAEKKDVGMEGLLNKLKGDDEKADEEPKEDEKQDEVKEPSEDPEKQDEEAAKEPEKEEEEYQDPILSGLPQGSIGAKVMWVISLPLTLPLWITLPDPAAPKKRKFFIITFIGSILWIAVFSYFMVWWATVAGKVIGISDAVMGLTFLAAGTSVPDLITSVLVAKQGHGDMAVSSSIGSNIFDVTVGLPLPWLLYCAINQVPMEVSSTGMGCSIGMLFAMLLIVFVSIIAFKWKMTKAMGGVMIVLYVVFVVVSLGLSECWFICPFDRQ